MGDARPALRPPRRLDRICAALWCELGGNRLSRDRLLRPGLPLLVRRAREVRDLARRGVPVSRAARHARGRRRLPRGARARDHGRRRPDRSRRCVPGFRRPVSADYLQPPKVASGDLTLYVASGDLTPMPLLFDVAIILAAAFPLLFLGKRFRVPEVIAYLVTGIVIGPHALGWIRDTRQVEVIAELGVALILFFIGLHLPFDKLRTLGKTTLVSGSLQMGLTVLLVVLVGMPFGSDPRRTAFYGILVALGSTAGVIVLIVATIAAAGRLGISAALGAFAAGVVVGDTEFIHEIGGTLRPFRH